MTIFTDLDDWVVGDSRDFQITLTDNAGTAIDIQADLLIITFKLDPANQADGAADLQVKTTVPNGTDGSNGIGFLNVEASDTSPLVAGTSYEYDIQWVQKSTAPENVHTLQKGKVKMVQEITRDTT